MEASTPLACGILNIAKPPGPTSHDIVNRLRRTLGIRRIGHSGTLDPLAEGVLLIGVGSATRLLEYLNDLPKRYRARLRFGEATDTQDCTGTVIARASAGHLTAAAVEAALDRFLGEIEQLPPMYSAVKIEGERLYERARRGEVVPRTPRRVTISEIEMREFQPGPAAEATLEVRCSSGTYVRTLCHDLGAAVGTGAVMTALTRLAIGPFRLETSITLDDLERVALAREPIPWIAPSEAVGHLPAVHVDAAEAAALRQGKPVPLSNGVAAPILRILDASDDLVAIGKTVTSDPSGPPCIAPGKVFPPAHADS